MQHLVLLGAHIWLKLGTLALNHFSLFHSNPVQLLCRRLFLAGPTYLIFIKCLPLASASETFQFPAVSTGTKVPDLRQIVCSGRIKHASAGHADRDALSRFCDLVELPENFRYVATGSEAVCSSVALTRSRFSYIIQCCNSRQLLRLRLQGLVINTFSVAAMASPVHTSVYLLVLFFSAAAVDNVGCTSMSRTTSLEEDFEAASRSDTASPAAAVLGCWLCRKAAIDQQQATLCASQVCFLLW